MKAKKNQIMLVFTALFMSLVLLVVFLHHYFGWLDRYLMLTGRMGNDSYSTILTVLFIIPVIFLVSAFLLYRKERNHKTIEWFIMLSLTFASIAIIAIGDGLVEYHFSIFMVLAALAYYEHIRLIVVSTIIFALHHFIGYATIPELICGTGDYPFTLLMIHAVFLLATAGVLIVQIAVRQRHQDFMKAQEEKHQTMIQTLMDKVAITSSVVSTNIEKLDETSKTSMEAANRNKESFDQIDAGATLQVNNAQNSRQSLERVVQVAEEIVSKAHQSQTMAKDANRSSKDGSEYMQKTMASIQEIADHMNNMTDEMKNLNEKSKQIGSISSFITAIAEQTNLLSLNATIEASRAGKVGKGFSVVAKEMRELSIQSNANARAIINLITEIQNGTENVDHRMNETLAMTNDGLKQSEETYKLFAMISQKVANLNEGVQASRSYTNEIHQETEKALKNVESMTAVTEQYMETVKANADISEKQRNDSSIVESSIEELKEMIRDLNEEIYELKAQEI